MLATYVFAADFRAIGLTVALIVFIGFAAVFVWNMVRARPELGSEIELAANRKEYLSDEELEGEKLDRSLSFALVLLTLLAVTLPFYWIAEPGRQEGAADAYNLSFESRGEGSYLEGAQCVNCHAGGGVGGTAPYVLQDVDGQFIANASWQAPALNNVLLRYSEDEVRYILNFGRPGSPMAAWGTPGGGPLTTQQVDNIVVYLRTLQQQSLDVTEIALAGDVDPQDPESVEAQEAADEVQEAVVAEVERSLADGEYETIGEAVFNLGLQSGFAGGAFSCGRCHTAGWSLGLDAVPEILDEGHAGCGGGNPSGIGFNLCGGSVKDRFPDDSWLRPDGTWYALEQSVEDGFTRPSEGNPVGYDGTYIEAMDGTRVDLDDSGNPITDDGEPYIILPGAETAPSAAADGDDDETDEEADATPTSTEDRDGDLAECGFVSGLWEPEGGSVYAFDPSVEIAEDENGAFIDPDPLELADAGADAIVLPDGQIIADCNIIEMPPRTSQTHYAFVYDGADAGEGYGRGGLSAAGMMPGFGRILPPEYIQAVVDYERGL